MKKLHEELTCTICETDFIGRKTSNPMGDICPSCQANNELAETFDGDRLSVEMLKETNDQKED